MAEIVRLPVPVFALTEGDPDDVASAMLQLAEDTRRKSIDRSTQTGAVLVAPDRRILSAQHNGMPDGVLDRPERHLRPWKYSYFEHAERRTIYDCAAGGRATRGATMYASHFPCDDCARGMAECKVAHLVVNAASMDIGLTTRFFDKMRSAGDILNETGVSVRMFHPQFHEAIQAEA